MVDLEALRSLQHHLAACNWRDLAPDAVVALLSALSSLCTQATVAASSAAHGVAASGSSAAAAHVLEPGVMSAAYGVLKSRVEGLSPEGFAAACNALASTNHVRAALLACCGLAPSLHMCLCVAALWTT